MSFRYDLFISYARKDNQRPAPDQPGWITALIDELQRTHRQFTPEDLAVFFDKDGILVAQDWELRIKSALRDSNLLLACLSPNYFASEWCRREWELYARHEQDRALGGEGVHPIYFISAPGFEGQAANEWAADLRRRQHLDLRPWFHEGVAALQREDARRRLELLDQQIDAARDRSLAALQAPGTVDSHNPHFVGRREEMRRLREMLACGAFGVITAVQGLGGVGKTALANEYAHAYAAEYGGGRWLVRCEGQDNLATVLLQLATPLRIEFNDLEKKDPELGVRRILSELEARTASVRTEKHPHPACLLIFDNVDKPALLAPAQTARLPKAPWLHILATTRLGQDQLFERQPDRQFLALDELEEEDALLLIRKLQPGGEFASHAESEAARAIVRRLGGFTLAVEAVAVYLGVHPEIACDEFRQRLDAEGLDAPEDVVSDGGVGDHMRHREKQLSAAIGPMLDTLSAEERFVLASASLLPADYIPLPWLRALAEEEYPSLAASRPGYPPQWPQVTRRLLGRRLLIPTTDRDANGAPRTMRMHRLVQELIQRRGWFPAEDLYGMMVHHAVSRCEFLRDGWLEWGNRWELHPLGALAGLLLDREESDSLAVANAVALVWMHLGNYGAAELLLRRALEGNERVLGPEHPNTLTSVNNLAMLLKNQGDYAAAEPLLRRALEAYERVQGPEHPDTLRGVNNLATLLQNQGDYAAAEPLLRRALEAYERVLGPEHPHTLRSFNNLAMLLHDQGDYAAAEPLLRRALEGSERVLGPDHLETLRGVNNLAMLLQNQGEYAAAEPLLRRALEGYERVLGPDHPDTLISVNNLAMLLHYQGDYAGAEVVSRRALETCECVLGPEHPYTLASVNNLAMLLRNQRDYAAAEPLLRRASEAYERLLGPDHPDTLRGVSNLAMLLQDQGDYAAAGPLLRWALEGYERVLGPDHPDTLRTVNNLAMLLQNQGDYAGAELTSRRALEACERVLGPEHPHTLASVNNLAMLLQDRGDYAAAGPLSRRALEADERVFGPEHPVTLTSVNNLAILLQNEGDYAAAEPLLRRVLEARERVLGPEHPDTIKVAENLEQLLQRRTNNGSPSRL
jgi:tetratricopeptide (TPR) repeat protein